MILYRVFGGNDAQPVPAALLEHLQSRGLPVTGRFRGDDQGWFSVKLGRTPDEILVQVERFLATEEGIRAELNTWAAWLETRAEHPEHERLMRDMIGTRQLFTIEIPEEDEVEENRELCLVLCGYLARETAGVYQVDGEGFFTTEGGLLLPE
jgi:hypothetical protein